MIQGIGMALLEGTWVDPRFGRFVNASMADYLVPVNADIRHIDAIWVDEADPHVNAIIANGGPFGTAFRPTWQPRFGGAFLDACPYRN